MNVIDGKEFSIYYKIPVKWTKMDCWCRVFAVIEIEGR